MANQQCVKSVQEHVEGCGGVWRGMQQHVEWASKRLEGRARRMEERAMKVQRGGARGLRGVVLHPKMTREAAFEGAPRRCVEGALEGAFERAAASG